MRWPAPVSLYPGRSVAVAFSWKIAIGIVMMLSLNRFIVVARRYARKQTRKTRNLIIHLADVLGALKPIKAMERQARCQVLLAKDVGAIDLALRRQFFAKHAGRVLQEPIISLCVGIGNYVTSIIATVPLTELLGQVQEDLQAVTISESGYWLVYRAVEDSLTAREELNMGRLPTVDRSI